MTAALRGLHVDIDTPGGRPLFRDLSVTLERGDRVALVGRNGVGKSTLLRVLSGELAPARGTVRCPRSDQQSLQRGGLRHVPQLLPSSGGASPGERRRSILETVLSEGPEFLLLDEPTHDLDAEATSWLTGALERFDGGLLVVSHDRALLRSFRDFFVASETGCAHVHGAFADVLAHLEVERRRAERSYVQTLTRLDDAERKHDRLLRRRQRKKNLGRIHELRRAPSKAKLNTKASYAQESQGKRAVLARDRLASKRTWAKAARRALSVELPLEATVPALPAETQEPAVVLEGVSASAGGRRLFSEVSLTLRRDRLGVVGPNGSGKTTLLNLIAGERAPDSGRARIDPSRVGYIRQDAASWRRPTSVLDELTSGDPGAFDAAAQLLHAHRFPLALAERPLASLSPGERLRAALLCLFAQPPAGLELLLLDEPSDHLDFLGAAALERVLAAWPGGLVVVSHDRAFLDAIGVHRVLSL